jgi:hypothetical protein
MIAVPTKSDMVLAEIMEFTGTVVSIAQMQGVGNMDKANAIFLAEKVLQKVMMNYIVETAEKVLSPSAN